MSDKLSAGELVIGLRITAYNHPEEDTLREVAALIEELERELAAVTAERDELFSESCNAYEILTDEHLSDCDARWKAYRALRGEVQP